MPVRALNLYYARDESTRELVLATRLRASDVREAIGIPRGRIFRRLDADGDVPDVMWDCPFADTPGHERDMDARAASPQFEAVRAQMRTLTRRFERVLYSDPAALAAGTAALGARLAQAWIYGEFDMAKLDPLLPTGPTRRLQRLDENSRLPNWIIEAPASDFKPMTQTVAAAALHPQARITTLLWERVS
jgi:hypothetical protein